MTPVFPYRLQRNHGSDNAELLLQLPDRKGYLTLILNMEQARSLAAEMHGLATDRCSHHSIVTAIASVFDSTITRAVLREVGDGLVVGALRLETDSRLIEVDTDVAAALSIAVHGGIPVFVSGKHFVSDEKFKAAQYPVEPPALTQIPAAFREVIQSLDVSTNGSEEGSWG